MAAGRHLKTMNTFNPRALLVACVCCSRFRVFRTRTFDLPCVFLAALIVGIPSEIFAEGAAPVILHVAPDGNDAWRGELAQPNRDKTDGPLASLAGAREAIRKRKERGLHDVPVRVQVATG